jgi:hypothetical protein
MELKMICTTALAFTVFGFGAEKGARWWIVDEFESNYLPPSARKKGRI